MSNNPNDNNDGRVAIVTGSAKGIGKAIALEFAKAGYYVMINDLEQEEDLKYTAEEISKLSGDYNNNTNVAYFIGDVSEEQCSMSLIDETMKRFGRLDVLVNNAAIAEKAAPKKKITITNETGSVANTPQFKQISPFFTLEEYEIADVNLKGMYLCTREAVKKTAIPNDNEASKKRENGIYSIINVSSSYESIPKSEADAYTLSMSGVNPFTSSREEIRTLTKTAALQLAEKGIRVNAILPGLVATEINKNLFENEKKRKEKENQIPFHRIGTPEEIAKIALFLASDDAKYITGSLIYADGGLSLPHSNYFLESEIEKD
ncbi:MAG: SDR family oxidoreductase [Nitrososphaeraceae archaeon]|nr:SDR family oxidoreductase [Nitrososphaeraceae archaeon]